MFLSLFKLKKDFKKLENDGVLHAFYDKTKELIIEAAEQALENQEKKQFVILMLGKFILTNINPINPILGKIFMYLAPFIIDKVYDGLKTFVDGLTTQ